MKEIRLGERSVGKGSPCFIIAEAGVNHNGDPELAKRLIDAAWQAGADSVKFQTFRADRIATKAAEKAEYQKEKSGGMSQYEMLKQLELGEDDFKELISYSREKNIVFLSTPFDRESIDLLSELGVPAFKIASGEITNLPLIRQISRKGKPAILSTGMATLGEIEDALAAMRSEGLEDIVLLHCNSSYPTKAEEVNLSAMETLKCAFKLPVGFSDHTSGPLASVVAAALGACIVEKHLTLDRRLPGPDHRASLEPREFKDLVEKIRYAEKLLGDGIKRPTREEEQNKRVVRKSLVARMDLPAGTAIEEKMIDIKRPGTGIAPKHLCDVVGRRTRKAIFEDEILTWDKLE